MLSCINYWRLLVIGIIAWFVTGEALLHNHLSDKEIYHIFGVKTTDDVPYYSITSTRKTYNPKSATHTFSVTADTETYDFEIYSINDDIFGEKFDAVISDTNKSSSLSADLMRKHCMYRGRSSSHNNTQISLVGCGKNARAMIFTSDDQIMIHPLPKRLHEKARLYHANISDDQSSSPHVIYKRSAYRPDPLTGPPNVNKSWSFERSNYQHQVLVTQRPLVMELAVFADDALLTHFEEIYGDEAQTELQQFVLTAVNNIHILFSHKSIEPQIRIRLVRYEVMRVVPESMSREYHRNGEVSDLLDGFCLHQHKINPLGDDDPRHWDHALLLSGYDLRIGSVRTVAGYAPIKGMCNGIRSCTITEGLDFGAVFVSAHEMGHSLGMIHDGDNSCDPNCCIMSSSVGTGKTLWSDCSVRELQDFIVNRVSSGNTRRHCLSDGPRNRRDLDHPINGINGFLPGQQYTLDKQCRIYHGDCWNMELKSGKQQLEDVCEMLWCGSGEGTIRTAHPALEGSYCGYRKWCRGGKCVGWYGNWRPPVVHGGWSVWNDVPGDGCMGTCSECEVHGQLRVRRSIRLCNHPSPNNGGRECRGSSIRGLVCTSKLCGGPSPNLYARIVCTNLRNTDGKPKFVLLGDGIQYHKSPCHVRCHTTEYTLLSVKHFPDGTPCGTNQFCLKGKCMKLACNERALVEHPYEDCPTDTDFPELLSKTHGTWGKWSGWRPCVCHVTPRRRYRHRSCEEDFCDGPRVQSTRCNPLECHGKVQSRFIWGRGLWFLYKLCF